jgi:predicted ATP-binding protein involved in virulence
MYINKINITNFKKIEHIELNFNKGFNLIIGDNSSGKTSVLEAISVALGGFLAGIDSISTIHFNKDEIRRVNSWIGDGSYNTKFLTPIMVECDLTLGDESYSFTRKKVSVKSSRTTIEPRDICRAATILANDDDSPLPIISYQSAARMWSQKRDKWNNPFQDDFSRVVGYTDCLDESSNTKMLTNWFKRMEQISWQLNKKIGEYESAKFAVAKFISYMTNSDNVCVFYDKRTEELMCRIDDEVLPLRFLSAGYRSMIGMVLDIACRMAILNPNMRDNAYETDGVVLIDELDLHLHPKWQWHIISALKQTFPNVQFIATTHSSIILSSFKGENIIDINDNGVEYKNNAYGYKINDILNILQGSDERVPAIQSVFVEFYHAIDKGDISTAEKLLTSLKEKLHEDDPDIVGAETTLELEKIDI